MHSELVFVQRYATKGQKMTLFISKYLLCLFVFFCFVFEAFYTDYEFQCCNCSKQAYQYLSKCKQKLYSRCTNGDISQVPEVSVGNKNLRCISNNFDSIYLKT